jgi:hypothetical protein
MIPARAAATHDQYPAGRDHTVNLPLIKQKGFFFFEKKEAKNFCLLAAWRSNLTAHATRRGPVQLPTTSTAAPKSPTSRADRDHMRLAIA